ncbi:MAG: nucleotide exchange factor GrpE, partial [Moraxellaceae bacterium]|nr:nucleotide exchange factor GrpE [Moraxellaceae bacterium]
MSEPNKPETEQQEPVEEVLSPEQESQPEAEPLAEDEVNQRIAEIELQMRDVQIRAQAEVQNIQRRAEREVANAHKYALEKFAGGLLEVVDNLERALQTPISEDEAQKAMHEGVAL